MYGMRNLCGKGKELTVAVNGESMRLTRSSRLLDTRPLRGFIITSICSFITCISAKIGGGVASTRDGMLTFRRSNRFGALLPFGPSWSRCSALESPGILPYYCLPSDIAVLLRPGSAWWGIRWPQSGPVLAFLEQSVVAHLPEHCWWLPSIEWVPCNSFVGGALAVAYETTHRSHRRRQLMMLGKSPVRYTANTRSNDTCITQKERT